MPFQMVNKLSLASADDDHGFGYTPHQFRHAFATAANAAGVDTKTLQLMLGHSDFSTTMNRYVHGMEEKLKEASALCHGMFMEHETSAGKAI